MSTLLGFLFLTIILSLIIRFLLGRPIFDGNMLLLGLALYVLSPFVIYGLGLYVDGPGESIWSNEFKKTYDYAAYILFITLIFVSAFVLGRHLNIPTFGELLNSPGHPLVVNFYVLLLLFIWFLFLFRAWDMVGVGYGAEYDHKKMGPLATINLLLTLLLLHTIEWGKRRTLLTALGLMLVLNSLVLLSMGGRMYVLIAMICLLLQRINTQSKTFKKRLKFIIVVIALIFFLAYVGVWRLGDDFDFSTLLKTAIAEPVLTSISFASYFECSEVSLIEFPYNFIGSFVNMVPSIIFPEKAEWIPELDPSGCIYAPFGATHLGVSLLANFGIIGSFIYMFLLGCMLKLIRGVRRDGWWLYYYICGALPLTFFRDGFEIFNKVILTGLIFAILLSGVSPRASRPIK